jgi:hypothetical protein
MKIANTVFVILSFFACFAQASAQEETGHAWLYRMCKANAVTVKESILEDYCKCYASGVMTEWSEQHYRAYRTGAGNLNTEVMGRSHAQCKARFAAIEERIGIGGNLAVPPLPHHRTYGSVYGGSSDYSTGLT